MDRRSRDRRGPRPPYGLAAFWGASLLAALGLVASPSRAGKGSTPDAQWRSAPSTKYGALTAEACRAELTKRKIAFSVVPEARGVMAPVRIDHGVGGIAFHTLVADKDRPTPWEVFDCRLVLALHDFSAILRRHRIDDVVIFSAWRPPPKSWPEGKLARRHPGALAVDVMRMRQQPAPRPADAPPEEGAAVKPKPVWIDVKKHFHGRVGDRTCGAKARGPRRKTAESETLRAIVCEAAAERLFTSMLTPNYDRHHHDHLHLEVTPNVKWRLVR